MITEQVLEELAEASRELQEAAAVHRECLACHCYREVVEQAVRLLDLVRGHAPLLQAPLPPALSEGAKALRGLLDSSEGKHG